MVLEQLKYLISENDQLQLTDYTNSLNLNDLVDSIEKLPHQHQTTVFDTLYPPLALKTFKFLDFKAQQTLLKELPGEKVARLLNDLPPDDRTAFLEEMPGHTVKEFIKLLSEEERKITLSLLGYPEQSVGRLMTPDYIAVRKDWTILETLNYVRENGNDSETVNVIYVIDETGKLIDDVRIREILFVHPSKKISDIMDNRFLNLLVTDDEEVAISIFRKNNRFALPVTDANGILLGIVTIDDVLRLAEKEDTEDIHKIGGTEVLDEPYMQTPFLELMKKRAGWLIVLFIGEMLTATAMGYFEDEISKAVVLALFVPLIISSGGNSGSQASTLIIRAMALGEITLKDWWKVMRREIMSGVFLGMVLGIIGFIRIAAWTLFSNIYGAHWLLVAFTVMFSLVGVVLWGTISGSMLPLILKKAGADPATSSAPFVATLVDVTGLIIYFSIAFLFFKGTLL
ncbi:magnesium transporter [Pseudarcicella hirudinis]|uniref:Magnesium transporter MgtE n=1 Tax=Pseudarcicella hirudinis TaxID=1079859 RepID=A0A1I5M3Y8_9BACT|nr:magnesium transporter [Pseudarcicella hirudinis]SFP03761.1 magnesium transporter [Pseudarcicella hirudinis]